MRTSHSLPMEVFITPPSCPFSEIISDIHGIQHVSFRPRCSSLAHTCLSSTFPGASSKFIKIRRWNSWNNILIYFFSPSCPFPLFSGRFPQFYIPTFLQNSHFSYHSLTFKNPIRVYKFISVFILKCPKKIRIVFVGSVYNSARFILRYLTVLLFIINYIS